MMHPGRKIIYTLVLLIACTLSLNAQIFVEQTGEYNPFNNQDMEENGALDFADLDGDGDLDVFMGGEDETLRYFENTGDRENPQFTERSGAQNPMDGIEIEEEAIPSFVDIDGDEDFDLFVGNWDGDFDYFENTGTTENAVFVKREGNSNPLNIFNSGQSAIVRFSDIDNDGDWDGIAGAKNGKFLTYENTGTSANPYFINLTGPSNPLKGIDIGKFSSPTFIDIDNDADYDIIAGTENGKFHYIENTGTLESSVFEIRNGSQNPMNGEDIGSYSIPVAADLNFDSSADLMVGAGNGKFYYYGGYGGGSPMPIELISFEAEVNVNKEVELNWVTATETNNEYFTIERSKNGANFEEVVVIGGMGNSNSTIEYRTYDQSPYFGLSYYRLKQTDFNGDFSYSGIVTVNIVSFDNMNLTVYPNPSDQNQIYADIMGSNQNSILMIEIIDSQGRLVFEDFITLNGITATINLDPSLPRGIYHIITSVGNLRLQQKFIRN